MKLDKFYLVFRRGKSWEFVLCSELPQLVLIYLVNVYPLTLQASFECFLAGQRPDPDRKSCSVTWTADCNDLKKESKFNCVTYRIWVHLGNIHSHDYKNYHDKDDKAKLMGIRPLVNIFFAGSLRSELRINITARYRNHVTVQKRPKIARNLQTVKRQ